MVNHQRGGRDQKDCQNDQEDVHLESPRLYIFHRMKSSLSPILTILTTGSMENFVLPAAKRKCLRHFREGPIIPGWSRIEGRRQNLQGIWAQKRNRASRFQAPHGIRGLLFTVGSELARAVSRCRNVSRHFLRSGGLLVPPTCPAEARRRRKPWRRRMTADRVRRGEPGALGITRPTSDAERSRSRGCLPGVSRAVTGAATFRT